MEISQASVLPVTEQEEQVYRFMSLCKSKQISNCCHPNALMTLMEYLQDYASPETKKSRTGAGSKRTGKYPGRKDKETHRGTPCRYCKRTERFPILTFSALLTINNNT